MVKSGCDPDMLARFNIVSEEEFDRLTGNEQTETLQDKLKTKKVYKRKINENTNSSKYL